jgi:hypothetical protein
MYFCILNVITYYFECELKSLSFNIMILKVMALVSGWGRERWRQHQSRIGNKEFCEMVPLDVSSAANAVFHFDNILNIRQLTTGPGSPSYLACTEEEWQQKKAAEQRKVIY